MWRIRGDSDSGKKTFLNDMSDPLACKKLLEKHRNLEFGRVFEVTGKSFHLKFLEKVSRFSVF